MLVSSIKSNKGILTVGERGVARIDVHDDGPATWYSAGGNIRTVKCKKVIDDRNPAVNSRWYGMSLC